MKIKIPSFLTRKSQEAKEKLMPEYINVVSTDVMEMYVEHLEKQLTKLAEEEEKSQPESAYELGFSMAHNRGKREVLRKVIKDLKKVDHA